MARLRLVRRAAGVFRSSLLRTAGAIRRVLGHPRGSALALTSLAIIVALLVFTLPRIEATGRLAARKLAGNLQNLSWRELMRSSTEEYPFRFLARRAASVGNPSNPHTGEADVEAGAEIFRTSCAACHGLGGAGGKGPSLLAASVQRRKDWHLFSIIARGVPGTSMVPSDLSDRSIWQSVAFIRSLPPMGPPPANPWGDRIPPQPVAYSDILEADRDAHSWLTYSRTYDGQRHSPLGEIHRGNVSQLTLKWMYQLPTLEKTVETTPLVIGSAMIVTEPSSGVIALAADTGEPIWSWETHPPEDVRLCCGRVNRGAAVLDDLIFVSTLDARLVALDLESGEPRWEVEVADYREGFSITHAPLAVEGRVITGVAGGEFGIRGFIDAYDARTGERLWRFHTIPAPGEPGGDTWSGDSWRTGGGPTWMTGSFDAELGLLYWGVGNPAPDYDGSSRLGDNLYTNSVVALELETGSLRWHYQFTPHDEHDWDANHVPVLVDLPYQGEMRRLMLLANKNGFYYVLDRETGEFLDGRAFASQNWAHGLGANGRPLLRANSAPSTEGTLTYPGSAGATNWWPPSFDPNAALFFLNVIEKGKLFFKDEEPQDWREGEYFLGGGSRHLPGEPPAAFSIRALDATTGERLWEYPFPRRALGSVGGVLSTGGALVFGGGNRELVALDAATGRALWKLPLGTRIAATPITYRLDGGQRLTIAAGRALLTFGLPDDGSGEE